jgi:hypothetical protein
MGFVLTEHGSRSFDTVRRDGQRLRSAGIAPAAQGTQPHRRPRRAGAAGGRLAAVGMHALRPRLGAC